MSLPMQKATYRAIAVAVGFGTSKNGNTQVGVTMEVLDEAFAGLQITWIGHFTDKTSARSIESLQHMGWVGEDLAELDNLDREACSKLLPTEVDLVCDPEEYQGEWTLKVQWVNKVGGGKFTFKEPVTGAGLKAFAAQMKSVVKSVRAAGGAPRQTKPAGGSSGQSAHPNAPGGGQDDIPF